jgi:hypothetical protein
MQRYKLNFNFKGNRDYVHGTDIYDTVCTFIKENLHLSNISQIDMTIRKVTRCALYLEIFKNAEVANNDNTVGFFSFNSNGDTYCLALTEAKETITGRRAYDEDRIINQCIIDTINKKISLKAELNFTEIEIYVPMNKALLKALFPDVDGKWYFTRYQRVKLQTDNLSELITIELQHNFNFKLTKSRIAINNEELGFIYFSLV